MLKLVIAAPPAVSEKTSEPFVLTGVIVRPELGGMPLRVSLYGILYPSGAVVNATPELLTGAMQESVIVVAVEPTVKAIGVPEITSVGADVIEIFLLPFVLLAVR